jgi:L(+)-tartrate dehydratase beta subunit
VKKILTTPIKDEDLESLNVGDVVYLTGTLVTCRDVAHRRLIEQGRELPVDLKGGAIFHAGPIVRRRTTASTRWSRSVRPPACAWRSSRRTSSSRPA